MNRSQIVDKTLPTPPPSSEAASDAASAMEEEDSSKVENDVSSPNVSSWNESSVEKDSSPKPSSVNVVSFDDVVSSFHEESPLPKVSSSNDGMDASLADVLEDDDEAASGGAASPKSADGESGSTPEEATVACRSASTAASVAATASPAATSSPTPPSTPSPASPASPTPPPPPMGIPKPIPPGGSLRRISLTMRSGGIPCSHTVPGPFRVVMNNPSPPKITFLAPFTIWTS
mmetsp:Transcript_7000/g.12823  ORF Transcript_7000/g.12823 Transcript_7000/m.12823 type:complete len:232 (-) Transcript_7000:810-1505(-)